MGNGKNLEQELQKLRKSKSNSNNDNQKPNGFRSKLLNEDFNSTISRYSLTKEEKEKR